ncbi:uncharacterized protein [Ptychodera flava]|uniref:uncharacterized protein n=1 Tax=Ptychodera flava TaxID=63121 RepID=UPI003969CF33
MGTLQTRVRIGNNELYHTMFVIRDMINPVILGWDFFRQHAGNVDSAHGMLWIYGESTPFLHKSQLIPDVCAAIADETVTIPARTKVSVSIRLQTATSGEPLPHGYMGIVDPDDAFKDSRGLGVARTASCATNGTAFVQVMNITEQPIDLFQDTPLGTFVAATSGEENCTVSRIHTYELCDTRPVTVVSHIDTTNNVRKETESMPEISLDGTAISEPQRIEAKTLLNRYSHIFSKYPGDRGRTHLVQHRVPTGDAVPIKQRPRRVPVHLQAEIQHQVKDMLQNDVIEESSSSWASPVVLARKKNGAIRFVLIIGD